MVEEKVDELLCKVRRVLKRVFVLRGMLPRRSTSSERGCNSRNGTVLPWEGAGMVARPIYRVSGIHQKGHKCVYRAMMKCPPYYTCAGGVVWGHWLFFGSWFQILSHLHSGPQLDFQSLRNRGAGQSPHRPCPTVPLELGLDPAMTQWGAGQRRAALVWWGVNP